MEREILLKQWQEAERDGLWYVAWSKALTGLTAQQADWKPDPKRHSIWQIVNHIVFWRGVAVQYPVEGNPGDAEVARRNFEEPAQVSDQAWRNTMRSFSESHQKVAAAMANESTPLNRLAYLAPHDSYHIGQIMVLRALQNLPSLE